MFSHFGAKSDAVAVRRRRRALPIVLPRLAVAIAVASLAGCMADSRPVVGAADPADPSAGRGGVFYRSTIAPYTSMRPTMPAPWRERNEGVTPPTKPEQ